MKKTKIIVTLIPIILVGGGISTLTFSLTSCAKDKPSWIDPTDYVGNDTGSDWVGNNNGESIVNAECLENNAPIQFVSSSTFDASNLIIPKFIKKTSDLQRYVINEICSFPLYHSFGVNIEGSLTIPNTIKKIQSQSFYKSMSTTAKVNSIICVYGGTSDLDFDSLAFTSDNQIFDTSGAVQNLNPALSSSTLLSFLKTKGLPSEWTAA